MTVTKERKRRISAVFPKYLLLLLLFINNVLISDAVTRTMQGHFTES